MNLLDWLHDCMTGCMIETDFYRCSSACFCWESKYCHTHRQHVSNPEVKSKTKLECINSLNDLATKNQVNLIWVPGHTGIHGNERVDELANIAGALDSMGPEPSPLISESIIKQETKSWASDTFDEKWSKKYVNTKAVIKHLKNKIKAPSPTQEATVISYNQCYTGHGPFREHLARMKGADETSCPHCGRGVP